NASPEATRAVTYFSSDRLTLVTHGAGAIVPNLANKPLPTGTVHTITALPAPGFVFSNWTGDIASRLAKLTFVMRSNLTLQANFIPNPFPKVQGAYHGLFYVEDATNGVRHETSGFLTLNLSGRGTYSGQLLSAGKRYPFVGQLDLGGNATNTVKRSGT